LDKLVSPKICVGQFNHQNYLGTRCKPNSLSITPEDIIRMGIFVWAVRSQGLEPSAKCFCNMHELLYETKAIDEEQYHNYFGCYGFIARSNASHPVPTFWKRWPGPGWRSGFT
jgi:hypothetical protein